MGFGLNWFGDRQRAGRWDVMWADLGTARGRKEWEGKAFKCPKVRDKATPLPQPLIFLHKLRESSC